MSLIKVKEIGFGLKGNTLDITIAIPKGSYLKNFYVFTQEDTAKADCTSLNIGVDYIEAVKNTIIGAKTDYAAFNKMFTKLCEAADPITENIYEIYQIKPDFEWLINSESFGLGIKVSQKDITFVKMELEVGTSEDFEYSTECGEDITSLIVPLYNLLPYKLGLLYTPGIGSDSCSIPRSFIDKYLQIKAIELALCCKDYCKAAEYWSKFISKRAKVLIKECGCHGRNV